VPEPYRLTAAQIINPAMSMMMAIEQSAEAVANQPTRKRVRHRFGVKELNGS
jgi:hypothetical protein